MKQHEILALGLVLAATAAGCDSGDTLPDQTSTAYRQAVTAFYSGIAALQAGESDLAETSFRQVTDLAPGEPAGWANLGLTAMARGEADAATAAVERSLTLAPGSPRVHLIAALVAQQEGRVTDALRHLRESLAEDPGNLRAAFLLAQLLERQGDEESVAGARQLYARISEADPDNLLALLERARLALRSGATAEALDALTQLEAQPAASTATEQFQAVRDAVAEGALDEAARELAILHSELQQAPVYRDDRDALRVSAGGVDVMLTRFLRLPVPPSGSAAPDLDVAFTPESLSVGEGPWDWVQALWLGEDIPVALIAATSDRVGIGATLFQVQTFDFPGGPAGSRPDPSSLAFVDYDYDFRMDLALAGAGGLRLLRQAGVGSFNDVTHDVLPEAAAGGAYAGVWSADLDLEGDMDLVVGRIRGEPLVLWNLGDERFDPGSAFEGVDGVRGFAWADLDADGDPDATLLDADGVVHVFTNRRFRAPRFEAVPLPDSVRHGVATAVADVDRDATVDLVLLQEDGTVRRLSMADGDWTGEVLAEWQDHPALPVGPTRLYLADLDNNGDLDLVTSAPGGTQTWLQTADGLRPQQALDPWITDVADLGGEGRLDLIGLAADGTPTLYANTGSRDYYATSIQPRAARAVGDRRINSFGIGGEIEVRTGLLYQKRVVTGSTVHFGLGDHGAVDVARIIWPNGTVQAEFELPATNEAVTALQRLKGSCPWVFAYDGEGVRFVTDFIWRTALGLRINAQGDASVIHAEDWVRIRGDQLAARDGYYDVRITGELWESHFFDQVELMAVDHPEGTAVFVDERFTLPAPEPAVHLMRSLRPVQTARDQAGRDVSERVRDLDERYVDTFELGPYQGLAEWHYVEVDLGGDPPAGAPLWLVASGWVYPTDGSINFALAQAGRPGPSGVRIEVPDGSGGWAVVEGDYGFPEGKTKTILVDLSTAFRPGTERRVRLGTDMEVYWDRIAWSVGLPDGEVESTRLPASTAELRYRGFSEVHAASRRAPELPVYDRIAAVTPQWRDLVGYHTRFGDVLPLIEAVDDRYVIMNAGDELALRFPAPAPPRAGWVRDFVLIGDGWVKDGDYNNGFSRTLRPLPYHGLSDYDQAPGRLEDDPAYQRHPSDWREYHTRYVTPEPFQRLLVPKAADGRE